MFKYLLLVHFGNSETESYYGDDPDGLKEYAEYRKFKSFDIYELNKTFYSFKEGGINEIRSRNVCKN